MPSDEYAEWLCQDLLAHLIEQAKDAVLEGDYPAAVEQLVYATASVKQLSYAPAAVEGPPSSRLQSGA